MTYYWDSYWLHTECFLVGLFDNMLSKDNKKQVITKECESERKRRRGIVKNELRESLIY